MFVSTKREKSKIKSSCFRILIIYGEKTQILKSCQTIPKPCLDEIYVDESFFILLVYAIKFFLQIVNDDKFPLVFEQIIENGYIITLCCYFSIPLSIFNQSQSFSFYFILFHSISPTLLCNNHIDSTNMNFAVLAIQSFVHSSSTAFLQSMLDYSVIPEVMQNTFQIAEMSPLLVLLFEFLQLP